jgi:hypothetical protein
MRSTPVGVVVVASLRFNISAAGLAAIRNVPVIEPGMPAVPWTIRVEHIE